MKTCECGCGGPAPKSDKQENCLRAVFESIKNWCRCGGNGFWYEQIDGPDNMRKVTCEQHPHGYE